MPLQPLGSLLTATQQLKTLQVRVRRLRELQTLYLGSAPRELTRASRVTSFRAGTLVVGADNAAIAAKLKQLAPRLVASLSQTESEITKIRIEVQVAGRAAEVADRTAKKALTPQTVERFADLAARVRDDSLKAALNRFARRHAASKKDEALDHVKHHDDDQHDERKLKSAPRPREKAPVARVKKKRERDDDRQ
jgi:hypothetical protein